MNADELKRQAAARALELVRPGMRLGLGTGSTAKHFVDLLGRRVAVQEYGSSNPELLSSLQSRGAIVTPVRVYKWALPEDLTPLRNAIHALANGEIDLVLVTTATQVVHLLQVVADMKLEEAVRRGLSRAVLASIGPTTSEEIRHQGLIVDFEASHPKMGFLAREAAEHGPALLASKRR